jgi:hypothetical protein
VEITDSNFIDSGVFHNHFRQSSAKRKTCLDPSISGKTDSGILLNTEIILIEKNHNFKYYYGFHTYLHSRRIKKKNLTKYIGDSFDLGLGLSVGV